MWYASRNQDGMLESLSQEMEIGHKLSYVAEQIVLRNVSIFKDDNMLAYVRTHWLSQVIGEVLLVHFEI